MALKGGTSPGSNEWLSDVKPLLLPDLDSLHEDALGPGDVLDLTNHGSATFAKIGATTFQLDAETIQPQVEVWLHAEEGLTYGDEGDDMED